MKIGSLACPLTFAALIAACSPSSTGKTAAAPTAADSAAVTAVATSYAAAWSSQNAAAIGGMVTGDYADVEADGRLIQGAAGMQQAADSSFKMMPSKLTMTITTSFIRFTSPTSAVSGGTWTTSPASPAYPSTGSWLAVSVKQDSAWKVVSSLAAPNDSAMLAASMAPPKKGKGH